MRLTPKAIGPAAFVLAAMLSVLIATWIANTVERRSAKSVRRALANAGHEWVEVGADGLHVILTGTAPTEATRFRALSIAGEVVDATRVIDEMTAAESQAIRPPEFSVEILRNGDGISLIGLVPAGTARDRIIADLQELVGDGTVTDLLETADYPVPPNWVPALDYALAALKLLPRSKISVGGDSVTVTAIGDSAAHKAQLEADLARSIPTGVRVSFDISAPRPVISPYTLRFLIDDAGARFDACTAESERSLQQILAAARAAGAGTPQCVIGLGVPGPDWAEAASMGIAAVAQLGGGSITFSDTDVALIGPPGTDQAAFDKVVGELESNLPKTFAFKAVQDSSPAGGTGPAEFSATLTDTGALQLRGRLPDERTRDAVASFARSRFGSEAVHSAARLDAALPEGWPLRVLAAIEALSELAEGSVVVRADSIVLSGTTGSTGTSDAVTRILSDRLGEATEFTIDVRYDKALDPLVGLPTDEECVAGINSAIAAAKINFEPGSATIAAGADATLDKIAALMKNCADYPMEVGGHTDSQGREEMNLQLSQDRAGAVVAALMARRVLTGNLTAKGYGETTPIGDNETEAGREANRRIEFRLVVAPAADNGVSVAESGTAAETAGPDTPRPKKRPDR